MEPISLTLSVIPLFHSCIQYFQLFKTAESASSDIQVLLFQLDCHHEDLNIWGEKHGIFDGTGPPVPVPKEVSDRLETALGLLESLFKDSHALRERYGIVQSNDASETTTAQDASFPSSAGLRRLNWFKNKYNKSNLGTEPKEQSARPPLSLLSRTRWAISDKDKFEGLIQKIGQIVGQVQKILPVPDEFRNQTALQDIFPLITNLSRLRLYQTACASIRPAWSNSASGLIIASEAASVRGPGTISHWVEQVADGASQLEHNGNPLERQGGAESNNNAQSNQKQLDESPGFTIQYTFKWSFWFAFMPSCPSLSLSLSCATKFFEINQGCPAFISETDKTKRWGLGPKIKRTLKDPNPQKFQDTLDKISNISSELQEKLGDLLDPITASLGPQSDLKLHIYCPPCRCAVRTALILCRQGMVNSSNSLVRIDERIPSTCCEGQHIAERLQSFIDTINAYDMGHLQQRGDLAWWGNMLYVDKEWIENRIYALELELYDNEVHEDRHENFQSFLTDIDQGENLDSVVLVEATSGAWILQAAPFRKSPRMPKETEVYNYRLDLSWYQFDSKNIYRGTFTPSDLVFPSQDNRKSRKRLREENEDTA
ncbi:prion-inhibition and propagation-domain-containing protein [Rhypophila decipiens]|uniref:Prion-inhibition and propagation-domain-containing protein n=1 Tax=Rhypophila decipiens TaxID=261697 RepID=A0AAN6XY14_9PEZI|nr:prion-inhibition and propagation-domain-containing protein [Rhypophila decipiens]